MAAETSVIVSGARTPMGRLLGSLKDFSAAQLGGVAIAGALERGGVSPDAVEYVIMGHVVQAGAGQNTARQASVAGGISMDVPAPGWLRIAIWPPSISLRSRIPMSPKCPPREENAFS